MTPEQLLALVAARSVPLSEPVGGSTPVWTLVEAGFGAAGLTRAQMAAFWWRYASDPAVRSVLYGCLMAEAAQLFHQQHWPDRIAGRPYLNDLVQLAILEDVLSDLDRQRLLDRLSIEWPDGVWDRQLSKRYRAIGQVLDAWCAEAHRHIATRIREHDDD